MEKDRLISSINKATRSLAGALPIIVAMILLTSLIIELVPPETAAAWFHQKGWMDVAIGTAVGSIAAGPPLVSYVLAGELMAGGAGLLMATALIVSWVTVGFVQLPMESMLLGKRFAIYRNLTCFILAILVALTTVYTLQWIG